MIASIERIETDYAPAPRGHYAQATCYGGLIFVSNQLPLIPAENLHMPSGIEAQMSQLIRNVKAILGAAGAGLCDVVSATIYITDIADWTIANTVYAEAFGEHRPARTVAVSPSLHLDALVAMQVVAADPCSL